MKNLLSVFILLSVITACNKNKYGVIRHQLICTSEIPAEKATKLKSSQGLKYTQFGDFITSITPTSFVAELGPARYFDNKGDEDILILIGGKSGAERLTVDFTKTSTIDIVPQLGGNVYMNADSSGGYFKHDVNFKLLFIQMSISPIIILPDAYKNITLSQFSWANQQNGNTLSPSYFVLNKPVAEFSVLNQEMKIYYGQADSSYICTENPIPTYNTGPHIRSANFTPWTLTQPLDINTRTIISTLYFDITNIIHLYAGVDNIPYTEDDIVVFEPKFWDRLGSTVTINDN